jgi:FkbM family methyltransferase
MGIKERLYYLVWGLVQSFVSPKAKVSQMTLHAPGEYISDQIRRTGRHYELANLVKVAILCKVRYLVDIGSNIGNHGNFFSFQGVKGSSFEPSKTNFELLQKNCPTFANHNVALSSFTGSSTLLTYSDSMGNNRLVEGCATNKQEASGTEIVGVARLDDYLLDSVSLIKIDAEGSELDILIGAEQTIRANYPDIWLELHEDENLKRALISYSRKDVVDFLMSLGYSQYFKLDTTNFLFRRGGSGLFRKISRHFG